MKMFDSVRLFSYFYFYWEGGGGACVVLDPKTVIKRSFFHCILVMILGLPIQMESIPRKHETSNKTKNESPVHQRCSTPNLRTQF